jgi:uncharacterized delta-60 repeat protein
MLKKLFTVKLAAIALVVLIQTLETKATWGDFDTSFGFLGVAFDSVTGYSPRSVALQPDGRVLITGYRTSPLGGTSFFLRRYLSNGQLDTAFGTNGAAIGPEANYRGSDYRGDAIVVLANGKVAVAGWANGYTAVWQFTSTGKADKTFGDGGLQILTNYPVRCSTSPGMNSGYPEMNIQAGKLLLSLGKGTGDTCRVALVRLTSSGILDGTFGSAGESLTGISGGFKGFGTVVESDGKITVGGVEFDDQNYKILERKLANGQDDPTFTPSPRWYAGQVIMPGLVKMANGKYVTRWADPGYQFTALEKYGPSGVFESMRSVHLFNNEYPGAGCPEIFTNQNDDKLIVRLDGFLVRANDELSGNIEENDCSNLNGITNFGRAAIQSDDKMVVAGVYNNYLMLARLLPN